MRITDVRIKVEQGGENRNERLAAFFSITFDDTFVVSGGKIIRRDNNEYLVAMPQREFTDRCPECRGKNRIRAKFCNDCGKKLAEWRAKKLPNGRSRIYSDIAHPIKKSFRDLIDKMVMEAYLKELEIMNQPGYVCRYLG